MAVKTRNNLVAEIADRFGDYIHSTATGGSTTTIVDSAKLYHPDDFFIGKWAYIVTDAGGASAAPEGEERPVTDFDQGTYTLTVSPAFSAAPASSDTYEILPLKRDLFERAINAAIRTAGQTWMVNTVDTTTITVADNDYDYTLPTDVVRLLSVWYRDASTAGYAKVGGSAWRVSGTPGAQVLLLDTLGGLDAGDTLRLEYLVRVSEMSTDAATLGLGEPAEKEMVNFIIEYALFWLHERLANENTAGGGFRAHYTLASSYYDRAMLIKRAAARFMGSGTARTPRWGRSRG